MFQTSGASFTPRQPFSNSWIQLSNLWSRVPYELIIPALVYCISSATAADTKLVRLHWYRWEPPFAEAVAPMVARHTYDAHDCLAPTGTPSRVKNDL